MLSCYSIFDLKALTYSQPFYAPNNAVASRLFKQAANDPQSHICANPEDYVLVHIGSFDEHTGQLFPNDTAQTLGAASTFKERTN